MRRTESQAARSQTRGVGNVTSRGLTTYDKNRNYSETAARSNSSSRALVETKSDFMRIGEDRNVHRIPPRERDFIVYNKPAKYWHPEPHYFGYRVSYLPPKYTMVRHWGVDYYFHNGVYYRPFGSCFRICRPPFGVIIDVSVRSVVFPTVRFAYYCNAHRLYSAIDANNRIIDEQNRIIAQNNAAIAAQNRMFALNTSRADDAYSLADKLGLVQSYAYADQPYYYQDGVFYIVNSKGKYEVIVPPAGALVDELPDDYDIIVLGGTEFYKVDDTVYRLTLVEGTPYLEVLGQMYGNLAKKYDSYSGGTVFADLY